jgi:hypothetical protein
VEETEAKDLRDRDMLKGREEETLEEEERLKCREEYITWEMKKTHGTCGSCA